MKKAVEEEEDAIALLTVLKKAVEEKKNSNFSHALNFITSGRMTASEDDIPSARPAKNATVMKVTLKEAVKMKKTVRGLNIDLIRDRQCLLSIPSSSITYRTQVGNLAGTVIRVVK